MSFAGHHLDCIRGERMVFTGLDFAVAPGRALVLEGPNGSGKSSLLRLAAGLLRPAAGTLTWDGKAVHDDPDAHRDRLHYVGHLDAIKPVFTVAENIRFWAGLRRSDGLDTAVAEALETFGIGHLADIPGRLLSAGQKRRANLARIVAAPAPLWLLDEPTNSLDAATTAVVRDLIVRHCDGGGVVMLATHVPLNIPGETVLALSGARPAASVLVDALL